jgi:hypothetical protein
LPPDSGRLVGDWQRPAVEGTFNDLPNPGHPEFARLKFGAPMSFCFDPRLSPLPRASLRVAAITPKAAAHTAQIKKDPSGS